MIGKKIKDLFNEPTANIITPASEVAVLREDDSLLHAILVLSNRGYQTIPVLDTKDRVRGLISISKIVISCENVSFFNEKKLTETKVYEVMDQIVPILFDDSDLEDVLRLIINNNFICITHKNGYFLGIITRKTVLERFTNIAHNIENEYKLIKRLNKL
ncbi:CBS domain-containing protein [Anaerococcus sp. WCA-380-WT-2B]|uniref:CBS domain-containing protein n=1 Tax=Anaerococcus porci TaxID=2652269 RepID=A0A6N7VQ89_9FIRM|nr:cyclic-di-AMP-binding protein CbpB [Anaerococcus porci]MSS77042.1 CBS domain-containing protein [Anaerococcus porci]